MTLRELSNALQRIGIPDDLVALGDHTEMRWCIEPAGSGEGWEVYWQERGNKNDLARLRNEAEACFYLLGRLTYSQLLAGAITPRR